MAQVLKALVACIATVCTLCYFPATAWLAIIIAYFVVRHRREWTPVDDA